MDYDVWHTYKGKDTIIANVQAMSDDEALKIAQKIYGPKVWVERS